MGHRGSINYLSAKHLLPTRPTAAHHYSLDRTLLTLPGDSIPDVPRSATSTASPPWRAYTSVPSGRLRSRLLFSPPDPDFRAGALLPRGAEILKLARP
jgi:hypothetical protein